ncbi:MAG TPA: hypothetical protein VE965_00550, partial [Gammaproteobacteria bacterium]|nr:hypothetical protein [Gammaproteobacteria bacterium]
YHRAVLHILARGSRSRNTQKEKRLALMTVVNPAFEPLIDPNQSVPQKWRRRLAPLTQNPQGRSHAMRWAG